MGAAVLRANTRGHDLVSAAGGGRHFQGAAYERVDECPLDIAAWIEELQGRGYARIGVLGHSLGAVKGIFALAQPSALPIAALVAISPPRLSHAHFACGPRKAEFIETFAQAQQHIEQGNPDALMEVRIPLPYLVTAAGYVDRYGSREQYNVLSLLPQVRCPTLVTYGSKELDSDWAFQGMPEAVAPLRTSDNRLQVVVVAGADHVYSTVHDALADRIELWLRRKP
jgi:pimeloyl-ACP methyl ester carboxylesterase